MKWPRSLALTCALLGLPALAGVAHAADGYGKLSGVVFDPSGTPQMGATIWVNAESAGGLSPLQLVTNQKGIFLGQKLAPGLYSVKATLAGFLPSISQHIAITANATTLVRIEMDSLFASLDELRRQAPQPTQNDDWKWVLRSSAATRPVLQFRDGNVMVADSDLWNPEFQRAQPHARVEMTTGSAHPGASSALPGAMATAVSYNQALGAAGRLFVAGRMAYAGMSDGTTGVGLASIWVPSGELGKGPETTIVLRQTHFDAIGRSARTMLLEHSEEMALSSGMVLNYGGEYVMSGIEGATSWSLRPHAQLSVQLSPVWMAEAAVETNPDAYGYGVNTRDQGLDSAIGAFDTLPTRVWKNGHSAIAGDWHEEVSVRRKVGKRASVEGAVFHDYTGHEAVFALNAPSAGEAGFWSKPMAEDAGADGSMGTRIVYREKLWENMEVAAIYAWAGALTPNNDLNGASASGLSDALHMQAHHSAAARVAAKIPKSGTQVAGSYKWVDGTVVNRQDLFGDAALGVDPFLSLTIRQPLPSFGAMGHWEVIADLRNILGQGYVPLDGANGQMILMPVERSFRGGVSFQF